ncbi:MAG: hypothetical protein BMS9Abin02_1652 [Anaerolineae bacterium]|nr:MAG: hypothetical protein BMS9Abin02_1652 [Anaerolineae bacterium]
MPVYSSAEQLYATFDLLFKEVQTRDSKAAEKVQKAKVLIRFYLQDPEASIIINGRRNPATITFDDMRIRPEVDVKMSADTFHHIILGDERLSKSLANGSMKIRGPARKALALADLFKQCQDLYPEILREQGIEY